MKKKILGVTAITITILMIVCMLSSCASKKEEKKKIESITIQESYSNVTIDADAWLLKEGHAKADIRRGSASNDELSSLVEFVINDENIAKSNSIKFDADDYSYISTADCELVGVSDGTTTGYFQTTDGAIKSEEITITVTGTGINEFNALVNKPLTNAMEEINNLGYAATYIHAQTEFDFTEEITAFDDEESSKWIIVDCIDIDRNNKKVKFSINTKENIENNENNKKMKETLESKLSGSSAWSAATEYGKEVYPYGFKVDYYDGYTQEPKDENTWFLKGTAKVTNEYNAKTEITFEAYVAGTTENPEVIEFNVY